MAFPAADQQQLVEVQKRVGQQGLAPQGLDLASQGRGSSSSVRRGSRVGRAQRRPTKRLLPRNGLLLVVARLPQKLLAARVAVAEGRGQVLNRPLQGPDVGPLEFFAGAGGEGRSGHEAESDATNEYDTQPNHISELRHNITPLLGQEEQAEIILLLRSNREPRGETHREKAAAFSDDSEGVRKQ